MGGTREPARKTPLGTASENQAKEPLCKRLRKSSSKICGPEHLSKAVSIDATEMRMKMLGRLLCQTHGRLNDGPRCLCNRKRTVCHPPGRCSRSCTTLYDQSMASILSSKWWDRHADADPLPTLLKKCGLYCAFKRDVSPLISCVHYVLRFSESFVFANTENGKYEQKVIEMVNFFELSVEELRRSFDKSAIMELRLNFYQDLRDMLYDQPRQIPMQKMVQGIESTIIGLLRNLGRGEEASHRMQQRVAFQDKELCAGLLRLHRDLTPNSVKERAILSVEVINLHVSSSELPTQQEIIELQQACWQDGRPWMALQVLLNALDVFPKVIMLLEACLQGLLKTWQVISTPDSQDKFKHQELVLWVEKHLSNIAPQFFRSGGDVSRLQEILPLRSPHWRRQSMKATMSVPLSLQCQLRCCVEAVEHNIKNADAWHFLMQVLCDDHSVQNGSTKMLVETIWDPLRCSTWTALFYADPVPLMLRIAPACAKLTLVLLFVHFPSGLQELQNLVKRFASVHCKDAIENEPDVKTTALIGWNRLQSILSDTFQDESLLQIQQDIQALEP